MIRARSPGADLPLWRTTVTRPARRSIGADLARVLRTGRMIDGPFVRRLEATLASTFTANAVVTGSAMDALELLLESFGIRDRAVLVPANGFPSIPALVARLGGVAVPVPVGPTDLAPDPAIRAHPAIAARPVVIWIHHAGIVADHARTTITALRHAGCTVIEDCAYLLPAEQAGGGPGTWATAAVLSFGPTKPLSGTGGGAVVTADRQLATEVADRRSHTGQETRWQDGDLLFRGRGAAETTAVVAYHQLQHRRRARAALTSLTETYLDALARHLPGAVPAGRTPQQGWGRFTIDTTPLPATHLRRHLAEHAIGSAVMFERPWFDYPALSRSRGTRDWRDQRDLLARTLCIPFHPAMTAAACHRVAIALATIIGTHPDAVRPTREA